GNTVLHLLARAEIHSAESISIVEYLTKKGGCDPSKQNDYGWTAGFYCDTLNVNFNILLLKT
ncbi:unnamed protein product, partial [Rotaria magnacalcarata]